MNNLNSIYFPLIGIGGFGGLGSLNLYNNYDGCCDTHHHWGHHYYGHHHWGHYGYLGGLYGFNRFGFGVGRRWRRGYSPLFNYY